uniref:Reverse transcriptase domain-containing protein n=1 Tax=Micrurus lemniscatus lemniscatus TaxID=129467 RepID=A0A2D4HF80_MICLE
MKTNTRIIMDVLEFYETHTTKTMALMFLDAQKAFDQLNWNFLIKQLTGMKFGEIFLGLIRTIYNTQMAKILINGENTDSVRINKGVTQGCPLIFMERAATGSPRRPGSQVLQTGTEDLSI